VTPDSERAVRDGDLQTLRRLRQAGSDLEQLDRYGQTALMLSAVQGHTSVVAWLIEQGAELDHASKYGLSATMLAL
jgi:ankyrin repeat protein